MNALRIAGVIALIALVLSEQVCTAAERVYLADFAPASRRHPLSEGYAMPESMLKLP